MFFQFPTLQGGGGGNVGENGSMEQERVKIQKKQKKLTSVYTTISLIVVLSYVALLVTCSSTPYTLCLYGVLGLAVLGLALVFMVFLPIIFLIISFLHWKKCPDAFSFKTTFFISLTPVFILVLFFSIFVL